MASNDTIRKSYLLPRLEIILLDQDGVISTAGSGEVDIGSFDNIGSDINWEGV